MTYSAAMTPVPVVITFPPMPPRVATTLTIDATIGEGRDQQADAGNLADQCDRLLR